MAKPVMTYVVGYSLDAVLYARELAESGNKIHFIQTGKLGYPFDNIRDYISYSNTQKIKSFDNSIEFNKIVNSTYVFFPYSQLDFVNNNNGLVSFPLNKTSFESAEEWEQIELCINQLSDFFLKLDSSTNYINIYKKFFPKWLYDSVVKYIGVNKWGGIKQAKFTKEMLIKEIKLNYLKESGTGVIYRPVLGYEAICKKLLIHPKIKIEIQPIEKMRSFVIERHKNADVIFMDNRIDYVCGYSGGKFDRVSVSSEFSNDSNLEEFIDIDDGIVLTPMKEAYWCVSNERGSICKVSTKLSDNMNFSELSLISPTINNKKIYSEYKKVMNLYSGKQLHLDLIIESFIL